MDADLGGGTIELGLKRILGMSVPMNRDERPLTWEHYSEDGQVSGG